MALFQDLAHVIPDVDTFRPGRPEAISESGSEDPVPSQWSLLERCVFGFLVALLVATSPISGWFCLKTIRHCERGLLCRFGKIVGTLEPGLIVYNPLTDVVVTYEPKMLFVASDKVFLSNGEGVAFVGKTFVDYEVSEPALACAKLPQSEAYVEGASLALTETLLRPMDLAAIVTNRKLLEQALAASLQKLLAPLGYNVKNVFLHVVVTLEQVEREVDLPSTMYQ